MSDPRDITRRPCTAVDGCERPARKRGTVCSMHAWRMWANGDYGPAGALGPEGTFEERFWARVDRTAKDDCWPWLGSRTQDGYGQVKNRGAHLMTHRVAYELLVGPIPDGMHLDHLCRVRHCVNPTHLDPVTAGENTRRSQPFAQAAVAALKAARDTCTKGHPYDEANTIVSANGVRRCRACTRQRNRRHAGREQSRRRGPKVAVVEHRGAETLLACGHTLHHKSGRSIRATTQHMLCDQCDSELADATQEAPHAR